MERWWPRVRWYLLLFSWWWIWKRWVFDRSDEVAVLFALRLVFSSSIMSVGLPEDRTESFCFVRIPYSFSIFFSSSASANLFNRSSILAFSKEPYSTSSLINLHCEGKGRGIDHPCREYVNTLRLGYTLLYSLLRCQIKGGTSKTFAPISVDRCFDHGYFLRARACFRGSACTSRDTYDSVLHQNRKMSSLFANGIL